MQSREQNRSKTAALDRFKSYGAIGGAFCVGWRRGSLSAAARCGAPPIPLSTRPRQCDQLQHSGTLRGADVITDHGAEHVVIAQRLPTSIVLRLVVAIFSFILFLGVFFFLGVIRRLRAKKKKEGIEEEIIKTP